MNHHQRRQDEARAADRVRLGFIETETPRIMLTKDLQTDFALYTTSTKVLDAYYKMNRNEKHIIK